MAFEAIAQQVSDTDLPEIPHLDRGLVVCGLNELKDGNMREVQKLARRELVEIVAGSIDDGIVDTVRARPEPNMAREGTIINIDGVCSGIVVGQFLLKGANKLGEDYSLQRISQLQEFAYPGSVVQTCRDGVVQHRYPYLHLADSHNAIVRDLEGPQKVEEQLRATRCLLQGLAHIYGNGLAHGDYKTSNILDTVDGEPIVVDWTHSERLLHLGKHNRVMKQRQKISGTPAFMAPEQFQFELQPRTDVWSAGQSIVRIWTGKTLNERYFRGADIAEYQTVLMRLDDRLLHDAIEHHLGSVAPELVTLTCSMIRKNWENRSKPDKLLEWFESIACDAPSAQP